MKRKSIKKAILIPVLCVLVVGIAIMAAVVSGVSSSTAKNLTGQIMDARVNEYTNEFQAFSQEVYGILSATVSAISNYADPEFAANITDPRDSTITLLSDIAMANDKVYGLWTCWEPNAFDGKDSEFAGRDFYDETGRFVPYIYKSGSGVETEALVGYDDPVDGEYYKKALELGRPFVTDPFEYDIRGESTYFYTFTVPILKDGKPVGVVGADVNLQSILEVMNEGSILEDGYLMTLSPRGIITTHPRESVLLTHYTEGWIGGYRADIEKVISYRADIEKVISNGGIFTTEAYSDQIGTYISFLGSSVQIGGTQENWVVCAIIPQANVTASSTSLLQIIIFVGVLVIVLVCTTIYYIVHNRLKGLPAVAQAAQKISEGNFNVVIESKYNDEIAEVSDALINVKGTVQKLMNDIGNMSSAFEAGEVELKIDESEYNGEFRRVVCEINSTIESLVDSTITAINIVTEFGDGNFDAEIKQYPGKREIFTTSLKAVQSNLKKFNTDLSHIIVSAASGNLGVNMDVSMYKGDWSQMAGGINGLIDAVVKPVREAISVLNRLSEGNLDVTVHGDYRGEFAEMKTALNNTLSMLGSYIKEISTILVALSKDDLDQSVEREYIGEFSEIKTALNTIIIKFNKVISEISSAADQVAAGSRQIAESSMVLSQGAAEQMSSIEQLNVIVSDINANTSKNAEDTKKAEQFSDNSKNNALKGDADMKNMLASMDGIKDSSNNISKIIKVIDDIASQTNLLALNAAVEATRAGEHGKGFAVVAEEVRSLAGKSKEAAKETTLLIEDSILRVNEGTDIAGQTAETLRDILSDVSSVAGIITGISTSCEDQAAAVNQVANSFTQITQVVQTNSSSSEETASASQQLSGQAEMLQNLVSVFNLKKFNA